MAYVEEVSISIHALLAESDFQRFILRSLTCDFYPRSPCGERPYGMSLPRWLRNFYPRSPCGERPSKSRTFRSPLRISIHALLAESDPGKVKVVEPGFVFLSTLSLRRATRTLECTYNAHADFYPRSPCGERPYVSYS